MSDISLKLSAEVVIEQPKDVWILTRSGKAFNPLRPDPALICIQDIAHALSHMCRFNGHCSDFYSVAEHSVRMSYIVPPDQALVALMHDATEAYIADICRPVKPHLDNYADIESRLWSAIRKRFFLPLDLPDDIKHADLVMLATERRDLMPPHYAEWPCLEGVAPLPDLIKPWSPQEARVKFLSRFLRLSAIRDGVDHLVHFADVVSPA